MLSFDETEITPEFRYLPRMDCVDGFVDMGRHGRTEDVATSVLVFGLRGVNKRWKQIISYYFMSKAGFDKDLLKKIVEENLEAVFRAGFRVVATVCDGAGINRGLATELGVSKTSPMFEFSGNKLAFLFDVPHIIKLIRNHLITKDLLFKSGNVEGIIKWKDIKHHLEPMLTKVLVECPRLTETHLNPLGFSKMRVKLATQLFSHSVASSFNYAIARGELPENPYRLISEFFTQIDKLFDILNSSSFSHQDGKPWKTALSMNDENSLFLRSFVDLIENDWLGFIKPTSAGPIINRGVFCLEMLAQSIRGVLALSEHLGALGISRICTRRFNQDILENHFVQVLHLH